jgi:peptidoglycan LD-endopeptidase LytH
MKNDLAEILPELFSNSEIMILDFNQIPKNIPEWKNIQAFFESSYKNGNDPKRPENRQIFNDTFIRKSGKRYLIGRYLEDRIRMLEGSDIEKEGRTIHLGVDIFSTNLEQVSAPCDGEIVKIGQEEGSHSFGYYLILKPDENIMDEYIFIGHLSNELLLPGKITKGQVIAKMGDYSNNENGGWSRHLHVQLLKRMPEKNLPPIGYSTKESLNKNMIEYPDPSRYILNS